MATNNKNLNHRDTEKNKTENGNGFDPKQLAGTRFVFANEFSVIFFSVSLCLCGSKSECFIMAARSVLIVGAGMGGLTAALRLARAGLAVRVIEARSDAGGLASSVEFEGLRFDAGPYILVDRPGVEWAVRWVGLELADHIPLR